MRWRAARQPGLIREVVQRQRCRADTALRAVVDRSEHGRTRLASASLLGRRVVAVECARAWLVLCTYQGTVGRSLHLYRILDARICPSRSKTRHSPPPWRTPGANSEQTPRVSTSPYLRFLRFERRARVVGRAGGACARLRLRGGSALAGLAPTGVWALVLTFPAVEPLSSRCSVLHDCLQLRP